MKDIHSVSRFIDLLVLNYDASVDRWNLAFGNNKPESCYWALLHLLIGFMLDVVHKLNMVST